MLQSLKLVLASQSPRRKQILNDLGYSFETRPTDFDERSIDESLPPQEYVQEVALGKLQAGFDQAQPDEVILASDLSVWNKNRHIHKPTNLILAAESIRNLWDQWHVEYGACVVGTSSTDCKTRSDEVRVWLPSLTPEQLDRYLQISDPTDKAGGFDLACYASLVGRENIMFEGDITTIIGLNATAAAELLTEFGLPPQLSSLELEKRYYQEILGT